MAAIIYIIAAITFLVGVLLILTGRGTRSIHKSKLVYHRDPGRISLKAIVLGILWIAMGIALLFAPFNVLTVTVMKSSVLLGIGTLAGLVLALGHARFERRGEITLIKWSRSDTGIASRIVGVFVLLPSAYLLLASLNLFGLSLTGELIRLIVKAVSVALSTVLANLVLGNLGVGKKLPMWIPTVAVVAIILFVELLIISPALPGAVMTPTAPSPTPSPTITPEAGPQIRGIDVSKRILSVGEQTPITVHATGRTLTYRWSADKGDIRPNDWTAQPTVIYTAPDFTAVDIVKVTVQDADDNLATDEIKIQVVSSAAIPTATPIEGTPKAGPQIKEIVPSKKVLSVGEQTHISVHATGRDLTYFWTVEKGKVDPDDWTAQSTALYTAPDFTVVDTVQVIVRDADENLVTDEIKIQVVVE